MPNMKKFFMNTNNIAADVAAFLSSELSEIKSPAVWKAELLDKLSRMETNTPAPAAVYDLKVEELKKFQTICGYTIAVLMLNQAKNEYTVDTSIFTSDALIEALEHARKVVLNSDKYTDKNFQEGFLRNAQEMIWTMICKAEARKTAVSVAPSSTETQPQDKESQENTNIQPDIQESEKNKQENKDGEKCQENTNGEKPSDSKKDSDDDGGIAIPLGAVLTIIF